MVTSILWSLFAILVVMALLDIFRRNDMTMLVIIAGVAAFFFVSMLPRRFGERFINWMIRAFRAMR